MSLKHKKCPFRWNRITEFPYDAKHKRNKHKRYTLVDSTNTKRYGISYIEIAEGGAPDSGLQIVFLR